MGLNKVVLPWKFIILLVS